MAYSDYFLNKEKKIPLPIVLVSVLVIIFILARLMGSSPAPSRATKNMVSQAMTVNVSTNRAGVYWQTLEKAKSWILLGESENDITRRILDERDVPDSLEPRLNHFADVRDILPGKTYFYVIYIQTDTETFLVKNGEGSPYSFTTPLENSSTANKPAYGKVIAANGGPVVNGLVLITVPSAYPQMALTKSTGEWLIPLSGLIDKNGKGIVLEDSTSVAVEILTDDAKSMIQAVVLKLSPLPQTIILGKNYSFTGNEKVLAASDSNTTPAGKIDIITPKDNSVIPGNTLTIRGTALPSATVSVTVRATKELTFSGVAGTDGIWRVVITEPLLPGAYTVTLKTKDDNRQEVAIQRRFTIAKSGEQVLGSATDSATPTVTVPTVVTQISPTTVYNTYPTATPYIATDSSGPVTGGSGVVPWLLSGAGVVIVAVGVLLAF